MYHIFSVHQQAIIWEFVDHLGIVIFIWSSAISFTFFSFEGEEAWQTRYLFLGNLAMVLALVLLFWIQLFHRKKRRARIILHGCFGSLALIPSVHCWCLSSVQGRNLTLLKAYWTLAFTNTIGGGIYATTLFDRPIGVLLGIPGVSHNLMHVAVAIGACTYECALLTMI